MVTCVHIFDVISPDGHIGYQMICVGGRHVNRFGTIVVQRTLIFKRAVQNLNICNAVLSGSNLYGPF